MSHSEATAYIGGENLDDEFHPMDGEFRARLNVRAINDDLEGAAGIGILGEGLRAMRAVWTDERRSPNLQNMVNEELQI